MLDNNAPDSAGDRRLGNNVGPAVRFNSTVQEIDPQHTLSNSPPSPGVHAGELTPDDIKALSNSLQGSSLQERRMNNYSFEPFSLPASRVCCTTYPPRLPLAPAPPPWVPPSTCVCSGVTTSQVPDPYGNSSSARSWSSVWYLGKQAGADYGLRIIDAVP